MSAFPPQEQEVLTALQAKLGAAIKGVFAVKKNRPKIVVERAQYTELAQALKALGFDHVITVGGTDYPDSDEIEVFFQAASVSVEPLKKTVVIGSTRIPRSRPTIPSLMPIWKSCEFHERETHEMLGVVFEGHPKLDRLLLPEDWSDVPPLRREFTLPGR